MKYLVSLDTGRAPRRIGNKADRLWWLRRRGFRAPAAWACPWDVHARYLADPVGVRTALAADLAQVLRADRSYAVRSSANVEDEAEHSFAGQFVSRLHVTGVAEVLAAIEAVWSSAQGPGVAAYRGSGAERPVAMAVLIHEMIEPVVSGVAFSKNPLTGMDEIVVEAVSGSGEALVQQGVTPQRWVWKWGTWLVRPDEETIPQAIIEDVVTGVKAIARAFGAPADLEWVYDGEHVWWVQLREITSIRNIPVYANHISKEMLPGIILPLVWSVNIPLVNGAWVRLFTEMIGPNDIDPLSLAKSFYYRAYFNMGAVGRVFELVGMPRESLELMLGLDFGGAEKPSFKPSPQTYRLLPRLLRFAVGKLTFGRQVRAFLPQAEARCRAFRDLPFREMDEAGLLQQIDALYALVQEIAYFNIVTPLLMRIYDMLLRRQLGRMGLAPDRLHIMAGLDVLHKLNPATGLAELRDRLTAAPAAVQEAARRGDWATFSALPEAAEWRAAVLHFLEAYGHFSDNSNNFAVARWREQPDLVLRMAADLPASPQPTSNRLRFEELPLSRWQRAWLGPLYRAARQFRLYREQVGSLFALGYGLFRDYFLALGERLAARGVLNDREDIFYLSWDEVRAAVAGSVVDCASRVAAVRQEVAALSDVTLPTVIYGEQPLPVQRTSGRTLRGVPTSRGYYRGRARAVGGTAEFERLAAGEVLVIPFSDVGWTPLFRKAGAVVAESGGMLSHSSIVAREYGIPAVVSVNDACRVLDGAEVTVDGYRGEVTIHG